MHLEARRRSALTEVSFNFYKKLFFKLNYRLKYIRLIPPLRGVSPYASSTLVVTRSAQREEITNLSALSVLRGSMILAVHRHLQNEAAARSGHAFQFDLPTVRLDDLARNAQPQTHALHDAPSLTAADEGLKDFILLVERDTGSSILHLNEQLAIRRPKTRGNFPSGRCELDGVT